MPASLITPLCTGRGDHGGKFAGLATGQRAIEQGQHMARIGGIETTGTGLGRQRQMENVKRTGCNGSDGFQFRRVPGRCQRRRPLGKQWKIAQDDDPGGRNSYLANRIQQAQADLGPDPGRFADRDRNWAMTACAQPSSRRIST
jgi:hypothetical protein